jgi:hypothetical protein
METVDFKKQDKFLYNVGPEPVLVDVPTMPFLMVDGQGDPNANPDFQTGIEILYALSYGIRMSPKKNAAPVGYYPFVVPPLEGLWGIAGDSFDFYARDNWCWTLMIRQPEFVTQEVFAKAREMAGKKKNLDMERQPPRLVMFHEGHVVQIMHLGPFETEPESVAKITQFCDQNGWIDQVGRGGIHHEIYLSDPRKVPPEKRKTIIRHPVAQQE